MKILILISFIFSLSCANPQFYEKQVMFVDINLDGVSLTIPQTDQISRAYNRELEVLYPSEIYSSYVGGSIGAVQGTSIHIYKMNTSRSLMRGHENQNSIEIGNYINTIEARGTVFETKTRDLYIFIKNKDYHYVIELKSNAFLSERDKEQRLIDDQYFKDIIESIHFPLDEQPDVIYLTSKE